MGHQGHPGGGHDGRPLGGRRDQVHGLTRTLTRTLTLTLTLILTPTLTPTLPLPRYACEVACRPEAAGKTIVVVVPSHGIRYVQHPLWGKMKTEAATALPSPPCSDKEAPILLWDSAAQP